MTMEKEHRDREYKQTDTERYRETQTNTKCLNHRQEKNTEKNRW
jgi:hypothetical protein